MSAGRIARLFRNVGESERGFSLPEVLIATAITVLVLAYALGSFKDSMGANERVTQMSDLDQNLRTGLNMMVRDFVSAGWGIPTGGIPIPSGDGAVDVNRPGPPNANRTFSPSLTMAAVNPGPTLGPVCNGRATDIVNILYADNTLPINQRPLVSISADGSLVQVDAATPITGVDNPIRPGDLIAFSNAVGNTIQYVTGVNGQQIQFQTNDPLNLNQPNASQGSITQLQSEGVYPPTTATRVLLISYYLDTTTDPDVPRLMRRINNRAAEVLALVLEDLQLSYDLVDGVTNPTNVKIPVDPNSPNQIRKVSIQVSGRSSSTVGINREFIRRTLTTQVSMRSLSFVDRYK
jgi:prepilin-type N-terminal cleavage/methylation domain-containing protein